MESLTQTNNFEALSQPSGVNSGNVNPYGACDNKVLNVDTYELYDRNIRLWGKQNQIK